jgi:hydrogenase maturation protease
MRWGRCRWVDSDYQLTVEDAAAVAEHDVVVFVDAACDGPEPYAFGPIAPGDSLSFSTHSVQPDGVLALARDLFQATTPGYLLGIRGYEFNEFGEGLSPRAQANLDQATAFLQSIARQRTFAASPADAGPSTPASGCANGICPCKTENT